MDFSKPSITALYTAWPGDIQTNFADQAKMFDGATMSGTIPTNAIRWSSANSRWEKWNGSSWVELLAIASATYAIRVNTADNLNGQASSYYRDATNINAGTLAVARGGSGIGSYAVGDIIYASATTTLSKLAAVAVGNVLISGGVTTAPSWGKVGLTTHVSGVLPFANGGIGINSGTALNYIRIAAGGTVFEERTPSQVKTDLALTKSDVGLGSVDNTADTAKPVSTAQQTALDAKAPKSLPLNNQNAAYTLVATDNNKTIYADDATGDDTYTLNNSVFSAGDMVTIVNDKSTSGNILLVPGTGMSIQWGTTTITGTSQRTIARGGVVTLLFKSASKVWLTGSGIS